MANSSPLSGVILIDCARANVKGGVAIATRQCGFGEDVAAFQAALKAACVDIGVSVNDLSGLITNNQQKPFEGIGFAPETPTDL